MSLISEIETHILYRFITEWNISSIYFLKCWWLWLTDNANPKFCLRKLNIVKKFNIGKVMVSHPNQLITSKHLQWFTEPLNGLSVWVSRLHNHGEDCWLDRCPEDSHWHPPQILDMGYKCRIARLKPLLKQRHRQKHLTWAKEKNNWTVAQWSKVLFPDESKFSI